MSPPRGHPLCCVWTLADRRQLLRTTLLLLLLLLLLLGREASPLSTTSACSLAAPHGPREEGLPPREFLF
ncbi:brain serine/threonine kinase 2, isoform CRA_e [Rattus norvegicus]|uniref:Brain serine/threonine kinase 2, isoform CRA_e n=1 Tax=Rattus norvegicus TaxID=10116 RepID=A6HY33_RAT|nr:brain serine/threonine kinase 2, isoform CRA_e [Rattus norvegicus]